MKKGTRDLLVKLAACRSLSDAHAIVEKLVSDHGFGWRPVGDRESNFGTINIGSDPGHALVERVTNAIDAVIEREALRRAAKKSKARVPASPREAAELWFGVPDGRVHKLAIKKRQQLADDVVLKILDGVAPRSPTIEVRDRGIGLTAAMVPKTILGLHEGNKIDKLYLAGAYGQGGSTALAFSPGGALLVSRRQPDLLPAGASEEVAITFARFNELDPKVNKNGRYEYLVLANGEVPAVDAAVLADFAPGTAVVHFDMNISQYAARMTQLTGSMWWLLQNTLFDPVLPLWLEERRKTMGDERRTIVGNFARLEDDAKDKVEYQNSVDVTVRSGGETTVKVNYWVLRQKEDDPTGQPITSYVDPYRPITFTFFGQTHGTEERRFVSDRLSLGYLQKFLIIQVELDNLPPTARRDLLSTTRDRLKQVPFFDHLREAISTALAEDEELIRLNSERKDRILSKHSESEAAKMRERFARLMEKFKAGIDVAAKGKGGEAAGRRSSEPGPREPLAPLPTQDQPTFVRVANTQKPIPVRIDRHALVRLESDAPNGYFANQPRARLTITSEPDGLLTLESRADFRGGRSRLTVRPASTARAGDSGALTIFLITSNDKTLTAKTTFRIEKPEDEATSGSAGKAKVQVPRPEPVGKDEWPSFGWNDFNVAEVREDATETVIYVNMDNRHIAKLLHSGGYLEVGLTRMKGNFLLYTAFYAWLKHIAEARKDLKLEGKDFEAYKDQELDRVAQTVVHSISAMSRHDGED